MNSAPDVTSEQVAAWEPLVENLARRFDGTRGAEFDDLAQEGRIAVWECLQRGEHPSERVVVPAMLDWVRVCARQGLGGYEDGEG